VIGLALAASAIMLGAVWVLGSSLAPNAGNGGRIVVGGFAVTGLAWMAMAQDLLGLSILAHAIACIVIAAVLIAALCAWRRPSLRPRGIDWWALGIAAAVVAVLVTPALHVQPTQLAPSHDDMQFHRGWIQQLLGGASAPGGVYAGLPNAYPWLYHALVAGFIQTLPGGLEAALVVVQVFALVIGASGTWLLARRLGASLPAARWSLLLFTAAGGVGWIWQHSPAGQIELHHNLGVYRGDLILSNTFLPGLAGIPPIVPRELAIELTPAALWLALRALDRRDAWTMAGAGATAGIVFLTNPVAGVFLAAWTLVLAAVERCRNVWAAVAAAAGVAAVWVLPLAVNYERYHGFVVTVKRPPVNPSLSQTLVGMGMTAFLGIVGIAMLAARRTTLDRRRVALIVAVPAVAILLAALLAPNSGVLNTPALVRWLRYLPFLAIALAVPAGCAAEAAVGLARDLARPAALAVAAVIGFAVTASTGLAAVYVARTPNPGLECSPPLTITSHQSYAAVAGVVPGDLVSLAVFGDSGASALWISRTRAGVRFPAWLSTLPPDAARRAEISDYIGGLGPPPRGVDWLVIRRRIHVPTPGFTRTGSCTLAGRSYGVYRRRTG
jgi:hypothetical protein